MGNAQFIGDKTKDNKKEKENKEHVDGSNHEVLCIS